jgi:threonylcarbamoyladenosine tRNA methylthiotransferase MtaB
MERQLIECGYAHASEHAAADVVVLNTCTVTAAADAQARDAIRHIHRGNPTARIVVTGCYAQRAPEELAALAGVTWVVGNSHQNEIARLLKAFALSHPAMLDFVPLGAIDSEPLSLAQGPAKILTGDIFEQTTLPFASADTYPGERTRPTLKIQDGCDQRCSYCVIPFVRGRSRSLPPSQVIGEIRRLAHAGYKEVVLSGINLGSYGRDLAPRIEFRELLRRVLEETRLEQLRISSIEPMDVTRDLVDLVASTPRLAQHFHMPLQSGSDRILRAMRRWYRAAHYARRVELIRERLPDAAIGADVIVGFPGETEDDYRATREFLDQLPLTYLHVFAFSARPGTKAAEMRGQVPALVIRQRARELRALAAEKISQFHRSQAGRTMRALTLHRHGDTWTEAITSNYLKIRVANRWPANQWLDVRLTDDAAALVTPFTPSTAQ